MSLVNCDVVDLVTLLPGHPGICLIAYDGGELADPRPREQALQKKLMAYLQFVISGQFARMYRQFLDQEIGIVVVCVNTPTESMTKIKGIRDHAHPETFLPVEITTDAEFQASLKKPRD